MPLDEAASVSSATAIAGECAAGTASSDIAPSANAALCIDLRTVPTARPRAIRVSASQPEKLIAKNVAIHGMIE